MGSEMCIRDRAHTLAELLGGTRIVELPGVPIDWMTVDEGDAIVGRPLGEVPAASGVAIVAIVRDDHAHPSPGAEFVVQPGDTVVAVGPTEQIAEVFRAMNDGTSRGAEA